MRHLNNFIEHLNENKINDLLSENELEGDIKKIKAKKLKPAQDELFLDEIISDMLDKPELVEDSLKGKLTDTGIIVSSDGYVIDGTHEWACAFILNPKCKIKCTKLNLSLNISLKILDQLESKDKKDGDDKYNIYKLESRDKLKSTIKDIFNKNKKKSEDLLELIEQYSESDLHPLNYIIKNIYKLPMSDKEYDRSEMPQLSDEEIKEIIN